MLRTLALRAARTVENRLERIGARPDATPLLEPYLGYATTDGVFLRGRVLSHIRRAEPDPEQSKWTNLRQMVELFVTDEVQGVTVTTRDGAISGLSDAEGYIRLLVPGDFEPGWATIPLRIPGQAPVDFVARVPDPEAHHMIVSDVDDTMIETGAHSLARNLWTTFTGSALTRKAHHDAIALVEELACGSRNPVFYVSSSPWNLHHFLERLFERAGVPRGPMFLRDLGITDEGVGKSHRDHKGAAIDTLLAANPDLPAYLLGDTGQKDAQIYSEIVERHPDRIRGVALRVPMAGTETDDMEAIAAIEAAGVPCYYGASFEGTLSHWGLE